MSLKQMQLLDGASAGKQDRPAPCARHCEATAFQITIKNLEAQLAQRTWVGLTRDEVLDIEETTKHPLEFYRAIEAKLKEKNT